MAPVSEKETDADQPSSYERIESALAKTASSKSSILIDGKRKLSEDTKSEAEGTSSVAGHGDHASLKQNLTQGLTSSNCDDNPSRFVVPASKEAKTGMPAGKSFQAQTDSFGGVPQLPVVPVVKESSAPKHGSVPPSITITKPSPGAARAVPPQSDPSVEAFSNIVVRPTSSSASPPVQKVTSKCLSRPRYSSGANGSSTKNKTKSSLRRGKWTAEEEAYVARVIKDFNAGILNAPAGTTLRSYLSEKLQCDPMRITKKFTGDACIGKRVFHPNMRNLNNAAAIDKAQAELDALEKRWHRRLEAQQRESAKKAITTPVQSSGRISGITAEAQRSLAAGVPSAAGVHPPSQTVVTRTAAWLDQANAILSVTNEKQRDRVASVSLTADLSSPTEEMGKAEIENQMKEVRRLISEGPQIKQTSADLSQILSHQPKSTRADGALTESSYSSSLVSDVEPADKRMRRTSMSGAEDAEALVGFIRSVRASAASGMTE